MNFHLKHIEYCKKQYHQKQFSDDFTWPYLFFFRALFTAQTYYSKGEKKQMENAHGVKPRGHQEQVSKSPLLGESQRMHIFPQQQTMCAALSTSSLERDSVPKIGTGDCSCELSLPSRYPVPRRKADFQHKPYCLHKLFRYNEPLII